MYSTNPSIDPSAIRSLTAEQQQRLMDVLDQYLRTMEEGVPPTPKALIEAHPDLASSLRVYLQGLDNLHDMAAGFRTWRTG